MKQITKVIALILVLTGCNNLNDQSMYKVDFEHLVRSAFYTQQALLDLHLSPTPETDSSRYVLLINSYCDLIDRGYIRASSKPKQCVTDAIKPSLEVATHLISPKKELHTIEKNRSDKRLCITKFHRCFKHCSLRNTECLSCEEQGIKCLN